MQPDQVFWDERIVLSSLRTQSDSDQINPIMLDNLPGIFREIQLLLRAQAARRLNSYLSPICLCHPEPRPENLEQSKSEFSILSTITILVRAFEREVVYLSSGARRADIWGHSNDSGDSGDKLDNGAQVSQEAMISPASVPSSAICYLPCVNSGDTD